MISLLWRGQEQEGWVTHPMIESVAKMLSMPFIRVLEVATFYTMFNLEPVGTYLVQVCTTTPCWLRGSDAVVAACKKHIHPHAAHGFRGRQVHLDGSRMPGRLRERARCCRSARISMKTSRADHRKADRGSARRQAPSSPARRMAAHSSEPEGGATTLTDHVAL